MSQLTFDDGYYRSSAIISDCRRYRYQLIRQWDPSLPMAAWVMCNPSTADDRVDDATIRKCMGFARRWDLGGILVANVCALRSRHPSNLLIALDPVGPDNIDRFRDLAERTHIDSGPDRVGRIVLGWGGALPKELRRHAETAIGWLMGSRVDLQCLGRTQGGQPRHPLMLAYGTPLEHWEAGPA